MTVTLYGAKTCSACKILASWLDSHNVAYTYVDVENTDQDVTGIHSLPTLHVDLVYRDEWVSGFHPDRLRKILRV